jgi:hypothetical protein
MTILTAFFVVTILSVLVSFKEYVFPDVSSRVYRSIYFTLAIVIVVAEINADIRLGFHIPPNSVATEDYFYGYYYTDKILYRYFFSHNVLYYFLVVANLELAFLTSQSKNIFVRIPLAIFVHLVLIALLLISVSQLNYLRYDSNSHTYSLLYLHGLIITFYFIFTVVFPYLKNVYINSFLNGLYSNSLLGLYIRTKKGRFRKKLKDELKELEKDE